MPFNGSGTFTPVNTFVPNTTISSSAVNTNFSDVGTGLSNCLTRDGQAGMTAPLKAASGSSGTPSITFSSDTTTGLRLGTGSVILVRSGVDAGAVTPTPIGTVVDFAGSTAPSQWLLCYGQAVSRTTYALLFSAISTAWGPGDGVNTFNLPDLRGRSTSGLDNMGGSAANRVTAAGSGINGNTLAATGGAETHVLSVAELASHSHGGTTGTTSDSFTYSVNSANWTSGGNATITGIAATGLGTTVTQTAHSHTISSQGSDTAHLNMQPTAMINKIIFAGV